jgi:glucosylglycerate synthase
LTDQAILSDEFVRQLVSVGEVDILLGVPTYNNVGTIGHLLRALDEVVLNQFARARVVIVNVDGGSRDGTPEAVLAKPVEDRSVGRGLLQLRTVHRVTTRYAGHPSFASALRTILAAADLLSAKSCAVLSPASVHVTAEWVEKLVRPTFQDGFDYVAPLYRRSKFDGLLIREALYPFGRAAYGQRVRELHAEEFGFSGKLAVHCGSHEAWQQNAVQLGPVTWMAIESLCMGFKMCQTFLGTKSRAESAANGDAVSPIQRTLGTLFWCLDAAPETWSERVASEAVTTMGAASELSDEPIRANRKRLFELFRNGVSELSALLGQILSPDTLVAVQAASAQSADGLRFDDELWVRVLYDFAASYHRTVINRDHLLQVLLPLYRGRVCSSLNVQRTLSAQQIEQGTERLCLEFERLKPYLLERWKAGS